MDTGTVPSSTRFTTQARIDSGTGRTRLPVSLKADTRDCSRMYWELCVYRDGERKVVGEIFDAEVHAHLKKLLNCLDDGCGQSVCVDSQASRAPATKAE